MSASPRSSAVRRLLGAPIPLIMLTGAAVATAAPAEAATYVSAVNSYGKSFPAGKGRSVGGHVGLKVIPGKFKGFCSEPNKGVANTDIVGVATNLPGSASNYYKDLATYIANDYFRNKDFSNKTSYRTSFAIWRLLSSGGRSYYYDMVNRGYLTKYDVSGINNIINRAKRGYGGLKVTVTLPSVEVGGVATGKVKITNKHNGLWAPKGMPLTITNRGLQIISVNGTSGNKGKTGFGYTSFKFKRTGTGEARANAYVYAPSSFKTRITFPSSSSRQRLIGSTYYNRDYGYNTFQLFAHKVSFATTCTTDCDGTNIPVKVSVVHRENAKPIKHAIVNKFTGAVVGYISAAPGASVSKTFYMNDGDVLIDKYCYTNTVGGACATSWVTLSGSYTVVCPAWAKALIQVGAGCESCSAGVSFTTPAHPQYAKRYYVGHVYVDNAAGRKLSKAMNLANGQTEYFDITKNAAVGDIITASFHVNSDIDGTKVLQSEKLLVKVQILSVGSNSVKVKQTVVTQDGTQTSTETLSK